LTPTMQEVDEQEVKKLVDQQSEEPKEPVTEKTEELNLTDSSDHKDSETDLPTEKKTKEKKRKTDDCRR